MLARNVRLIVDTRGLRNRLALGAAGVVSGNLNIMPKTYRAFAPCYRDEGWEGGVREPCHLPPAAQLQEFRGGLVALGVPEFDELARQTAA